MRPCPECGQTRYYKTTTRIVVTTTFVQTTEVSGFATLDVASEEDTAPSVDEWLCDEGHDVTEGTAEHLDELEAEARRTGDVQYEAGRLIATVPNISTVDAYEQARANVAEHNERVIREFGGR